MNRSHVACLAPTLAALLAVSAANAALAGGVDGATAARTFAPAFYEHLRPRTALDMVLQTPGFTIHPGSSARGLGGAPGNILINGSRPPAKAAPVTEVLAGIPARDVTAVVLVPAGAREIDMAGHGMLLDVLTVSRAGVDGMLAATGRSNGRAGYTGSAQAEMHIKGPRRVLTVDARSSRSHSASEGRLVAPPAGEVVVRRSGGTRSTQRSGKLSVTTQWKPAAGGDVQVRVNASRSDGDARPFDQGDRPPELQGSGASHARAGDLAAEVQRPVAGDRSTLSLGALVSRSDSTSLSRLQAATGRRESASRVRQGETAVRGALRWTLSDAWVLQAGADHAGNFLQGELRYRVDGADVPVPGARNHVVESRSGMFATVVWQPRGEWHWEAGLRREHAFLAKRGDAGSDRRQTELLPRVRGTWQPTPGTRWQAGVERQLGQLGFSQFLATVGLVDDIVTAGAPTLSAETGWRYSLDYEHRFGERGLFGVRAWRKRVDNPIDMVVLDGGVQAMANVEPTVVDALESQLSAPLDGLGMPGGLLSLTRADSRSSAVDPVTGEVRPVAATPRGTGVSLRQDLANGKGAWGVSLDEGVGTTFYGVRQVTRTQSGAATSVFGQWRPLESLMLRLGYGAGRTGTTETWMYEAPRSVGSEADSVFTEISSTPPTWDARLEWEKGEDLRLELGLAWSGSVQYASHALASAGGTVEYSSLRSHPSLFTSVEWLW